MRIIADEAMMHLQLAPRAPSAVERNRGSGPTAEDSTMRSRRSRHPNTRTAWLLSEFRTTLVLAGLFTSSDPRCKIDHQWASGRVCGIDVPPLARTIGVKCVDFVAAPPEMQGGPARATLFLLPEDAFEGHG